jgi:hypothetical protein
MVDYKHPDLGGLAVAHPNSTDNSADIQNKIKEWLVTEGWQVLSEAKQGFQFALIADDGKGRKLVVAQVAQRPDRITIESAIVLSDQHANQFRGLPENKRQDFLWDLRFDLLHMDVEFRGLEDPLRQVMLAQPVFYDVLDKASFMQRFSDVRKATLLVLWKIARLMQEPPPKIGFIKS